MNKNTPILACEIDEARGRIIKTGKLFNPEYLPVGVTPNKQLLRVDLDDWWRGRSIPASRQGLSPALAELNIIEKNYLLTKSLGLSLSDQYWIRPHEDIKWEEVNFFNNPFSEEVGDVLFGEFAKNGEIDLASPDNTSDGWLKKRWKIVEGDRCLIKAGSGTVMQEPINEVFVSKILNRLNAVDFVDYTLAIIDDKPYSVCKNFITPDTELVTAYQIMQHSKKINNDSFRTHLLKQCEVLEIPHAAPTLDFMLTLDYLIMNEDRHYGNFGAVRDVNTLKFIGMAPIFDSGSSLWYDTRTQLISPQPHFKAKPFHNSPERQLKLISSFAAFDVAKLQGIEKEFDALLLQSPPITSDRRDALCHHFASRVEDFGRTIEFHQAKTRATDKLAALADAAKDMKAASAETPSTPDKSAPEVLEQ